MRKKEIVKSYKYFDIKRRLNDKGNEFIYIENRDRVEFIFLYKDEVYWRSEYNPAHCADSDEYNYYPFSATIEDDEMPIKAVERKIEGEAGLIVSKMDVLYRGYFFESKNIASRVHLFIIDVKEAKKVEPRTDRTYWKSFGKTLAAKNKEAFFLELSKKIIETTISLEHLTLVLKSL
jgi:hypothetical protein